jgi:hypothetical protein
MRLKETLTCVRNSFYLLTVLISIIYNIIIIITVINKSILSFVFHVTKLRDITFKHAH